MSQVSRSQAERAGHSPRRRRAWQLLKWLLTLFVLAFVGHRAVTLWRAHATESVSIHWGWILLAGLIYLVGWLPSVWFYRALLQRMGDEVPWPGVIRAYYCGHLGKYVPGKAFVPVIRGQLIAEAGGRFRTGALAAVYETLMMMGVALELSVLLLPWFVSSEGVDSPAWIAGLLGNPQWRALLERPFILALLAVLVMACSIPVAAWLFSHVAGHVVARDESTVAAAPRIDARLIAAGFVVFSLAWAIQGLSIWATLRGIGAEVSVTRMAHWTACAALPTALGFLALFAPGGVGVREGVMMELLKFQPGIEPRAAIATAFLQRVIGLLAELVASGVLYWGMAPRRRAGGANASRYAAVEMRPQEETDAVDPNSRAQ